MPKEVVEFLLTNHYLLNSPQSWLVAGQPFTGQPFTFGDKQSQNNILTPTHQLQKGNGMVQTKKKQKYTTLVCTYICMYVYM